MADADDLDLIIRMEKFLHSLCLYLNRTCRRFLHHDIAALGILEREDNKLHRLFQAHNESCHGRLCNRDRMAVLNLLDPERDHGASGTHHVAVACTADACLLRRDSPGLGHDHLLHHRLGCAHRIHRISRLVRRQTDHLLHARLDRRGQHVLRTEHVRLHRLDREELAGRDLLQRRRMEDVIHAVHGVLHRLNVPDISYVKLDLVAGLRILRLILMAHIILLLLITGENADLPDIRIQKTIQDGVAERTGATGDQ